MVRPLRRPIRGPSNGVAPGQAADPVGGRNRRHANVRTEPGGDWVDAQTRCRDPPDGLREGVAPERGKAVSEDGHELT